MIEQEDGIKKDIKPYIIFRCSKCQQYMYVKPTQKGKKCLRCGRMHSVDKIKKSYKVEVVEGMSAAAERVKDLQNNYAIEEFQEAPLLRGEDGFSIASEKRRVKIRTIKKEEENDTLENRFTSLLQDISKDYKQFPKYMIELLAENYHIEKKELKMVIQQFLNDKKLIKSSNNYFIKNF